MPVYIEATQAAHSSQVDTDNSEYSAIGLTARITGEIDHHSAKWLRADIDTAINDNRPEVLRLDFSGVTFMDSSGIGLVMGRCVRMKEIGGRVELVNMPKYIENVMTLAGMDKLTGKCGDIDMERSDKHGK